MAVFNVPFKDVLPILETREINKPYIPMMGAAPFDGNAAPLQSIAARNRAGLDFNIPYNPRTDLNPTGNFGQLFNLDSNLEATDTSTQQIHDYFYNSLLINQVKLFNNTGFIGNGLTYDFDYAGAYRFRIEELLLTAVNGNTDNPILPMSDVAPTPTNMTVTQEVPTIVRDSSTPSLPSHLIFDRPITKPNPAWPPIPPVDFNVVTPDPANGIGVIKWTGYGYEVSYKEWVEIPVESVTECPVVDTTDYIAVNISDPNDITICPYDIAGAIVVISDVDPTHIMAGVLIEHTATITLDIYGSAKIMAWGNLPVVENTVYYPETDELKTYWPLGEYDFESLEGLYGFARYYPDGLGGGDIFVASVILCHIKIVNDVVIDLLYYLLDGITPDYDQFILDNFGIGLLGQGTRYDNGDVFITRQTLEYVDPYPTAGYDDEFKLDGWVNEYPSGGLFYPDVTADGGFTAMGVLRDIDGKLNIALILRNGSGWYRLDDGALDDLLDTVNSNDEGYYPGDMVIHNNIIYIQFSNSSSSKYYALRIGLPRGRLPRVVLDYNAVGISFIPCQTHCLGKGGIFSKV